MIWLIDAQNLLLTMGALVRWYAGDGPAERKLFGAIFVYQFLYQVILFYNNHFVAGDPSFGPAQASLVTIAFAVLMMTALAREPGGFSRRAGPRVARMVRAVSPMLLAGGLLVLSLFIVRINYPVGTVGIALAVIGYTLRNSLNQARYIERGDLLQQERSELQAIAWSDALTGLANRYMLDRTLDAITRNGQPLAQPLAVLMVDLDYFKNLNDHYGHPTGDACLKSVARALQHAVVRPNDMVARYGGEEFVVLIEDTDELGAAGVAERLRVAIADLGIENLGSPLGIVTASVGAASALRLQRVTSGDLVATADRALYDAKHGGRNQSRTLRAA
jgi:diguanylate cyclase (GGDEF)-like protein